MNLSTGVRAQDLLTTGGVGLVFYLLERPEFPLPLGKRIGSVQKSTID